MEFLVVEAGIGEGSEVKDDVWLGLSKRSTYTVADGDVSCVEGLKAIGVLVRSVEPGYKVVSI
jgi:hypothetical protein